MTSIEEVLDDEKKEDFLEVDPPIPGQNYCCLSFISPEKFIQEKTRFLFFNFYKELTKNELLKKSLDEKLNLKTFEDKFEDFLVGKQKKLDDDYNELVDFKTSIRGLKVRGTYETEREAKIRAEVLRRRFPNDNVFVGQIGYWLPWDPNPLDIKNLEYQETELNTLMKKYYENMEQREHMFEEERRTKMYQDKNEDEKPTNDEETENKEKFNDFRNILNEKDKLMASGDAWMDRKLEEKNEPESEPEVTESEDVQVINISNILEPEPEV